jgi:hypothetical protein
VKVTVRAGLVSSEIKALIHALAPTRPTPEKEDSTKTLDSVAGVISVNTPDIAFSLTIILLLVFAVNKVAVVVPAGNVIVVIDVFPVTWMFFTQLHPDKSNEEIPV